MITVDDLFALMKSQASQWKMVKEVLPGKTVHTPFGGRHTIAGVLSLRRRPFAVCVTYVEYPRSGGYWIDNTYQIDVDLFDLLGD